ncbi:hypothetical protein FOG48_01177 [Hanseniaspora uvarum]|nr:hypothetical protein FOG48_01177 [Hanseniaspora uvarum]
MESYNTGEDGDSNENLHLKTFKNTPSNTIIPPDKTKLSKRKSLQALISIEPEPIDRSNTNNLIDENDGIIQPEPNFIPMINSLLMNSSDFRDNNSSYRNNDSDMDNQTTFITEFDSIDNNSTINRLFFNKNYNNKVMSVLLKLRNKVNRINVQKIPKAGGRVSYLLLFLLFLLGGLNFIYFKDYRTKLMKKNRLFATVIANGLLNGFSDIVAQLITCFSSKANNIRLSGDLLDARITNSNQDNSDALDLDDLEYQNSLIDNDSIYLLDSIEHTNDVQLWRLLCFTFWGSFMANFQVPWYIILNKLFTEDPSIVQTFERILSDQLFYSPISLYCFFAFANYIMDAGDVYTFRNKIKKIYLSTLAINYLLWPVMQFINFSFIPNDDQPLFSSCVSVVWNVVLSLRNASTK